MENTTNVPVDNPKAKVDTYSYKGWMNSDRFLKRAFGVLGHYFVAALIIGIPFYILFLLIALTAGGFIFGGVEGVDVR